MIKKFKEEFHRRTNLLKGFYNKNTTPMKTVREDRVEDILDDWKELLELGYIKWSNTTAVTTSGRYCSLFPSRRGNILYKTISRLERM